MKSLAFGLALAVTVHAQEAADVDLVSGDAGSRVAAWTRAAEALGFSGAVLAARDGKVVAALGVGSADLRDKVSNTSTTLFEIASATKQFTAAAVMELVEAGKLSLDDSIAEHLPGVPEDCEAITVRHLLQHTSGIPGANSQGSGTKLSSVLSSFLRGGPVHAPGTHFEYWNQGYALLSEIIARASGEDYVAFCERNLFAPAGMSVTCFTGDDAPKGAVVSVGRSPRGDRSALDHPYGSYGFQYRGMGGAVSSVWDLWRWDRTLRGESVLGQAAKAQLFEPGLGDYALGWRVAPNEHGRLVQSHGGGVRGFACEIRRYPVEDGCLFVLCNRDGFRVGDMAQGLEEILFGEEPTIQPPPRPLDEALARALAGSYEDSKKAELVIERDGIATRATTYWGRPNGPVSYAVLGLDGAGKVILHEWTAVHELTLGRGKQRIQEIVLLGREFRRD